MLPYIHVSTTVTDEPQATVESFKQRIQSIADHVSVGITNPYLFQKNQSSEMEIPKKLANFSRLVQLKRPSFCQEIFFKLSVDWDGTVTSCCADNNRLLKLGNLENSTIKKLWNSKLQKQRQFMLSRKEFDKIPSCANCYYPMQGTFTV